MRNKLTNQFFFLKKPILIEGKHPKIVDILIAKDVNMNLRNNDQETPLFVAVENDALECVEILLQANADTYISNSRSVTPFALCERRKKTAMIKIFDKYGKKGLILIFF